MHATDAPGAPEKAAATSLTAQLKGLLGELPGLFSDRVELLSLELQRAAVTLAQIVALVVAVAILGVTAWLAFWAVVVAALIAAGLGPVWALLATLLVNLLVAGLGVAWIRRLLPRVSLPATRRHLVVAPRAAEVP